MDCLRGIYFFRGLNTKGSHRCRKCLFQLTGIHLPLTRRRGAGFYLRHAACNANLLLMTGYEGAADGKYAHINCQIEGYLI